MIFLSVPEEEKEITYGQVAEKISSRNRIPKNIDSQSVCSIFTDLLTACVSESSVNIVGKEFQKDVETEWVSVEDVYVKDGEDLVSQVRNVSNDWRLGIYTSGTTGEPKQVHQTFQGLTRAVRQGPRYRDHVWALAYDPTHFAGLQVFFQAVMNLNPMVYLFESSPEKIQQSIRKYGITHLSATPTFYRLRLNSINGTYRSVRRLTSGGEKFEPSLKKELNDLFPNAEFRNVYALTEAGSLLHSEDELFEIPEKYDAKIKVSEEDELVIHRSLLGNLEYEDESEWFYTGDLVEFENEDKFRFVGRKSDFINVGGYRVNPHKVEKIINLIESVKGAVVKSRDSSVTGNILVAKVQPYKDADYDTVESKVKDTVKELEPWRQPRTIEIVEELEQSRTGKRVRS